MFDYDVCIVGTGRVGLPLGLSFLDVGVAAVGVDVNPSLREAINEGRMPFLEGGFEDIIARGKFRVHGNHEVVAQSQAVVITVGTPLHNHIETDLSHVAKVLEAIRPHLRAGQLVCLRSTVAPGTTRYVGRWLERHTNFTIGKDIYLAFCPERIAEGKAREELRTLPQIIGAEDEPSRAAATALFAKLTGELLHTSFINAELVKLFNNIARYVHFALANQFALIADTFGGNIYDIREMANYNYPRSRIASPGFTAGTCLRKDFGMVNEWSPYPDLLLSAWKMNEYVPAFLVQHLLKRTTLHNRRVAILGYSFKADTDDTRDSLVPKLLRYVERELPIEVRVTDHYCANPIDDGVNAPVRNWPQEQAVAGADCVFVATNHAAYAELVKNLAHSQPETWIADIWNVGGVNQIFYQAKAAAK